MDILRRLKLVGRSDGSGSTRKHPQSDLYHFNKIGLHGFPSKPTSIAYDAALSLLAVGTRSGVLNVYGRAGVQVSGQHEEHTAVEYLYFLPDQGRVLSVCSKSVHLWELNISADGRLTKLDHVKSAALEPAMVQSVTSCCLTADSEQLLIGTVGGNVFTLSIIDWKITDKVFHQASLLQNVSEEYRSGAGSILSILQHPVHAEQFLLGFNHGVVVLWNATTNKPEQTYDTKVLLESMSLRTEGREFVVAHCDGSYTVWSTIDSKKPKENATTPYGPFPCKAITKIDWQLTDRMCPLLVFRGGMPRASYGEQNTVSVIQEAGFGGPAKHVVFDLASQVIDFIIIPTASSSDSNAPSHADSLLVLCDEELVAIDLRSDNWPMYRLPYLWTIPNSPVTAVRLEENVSPALLSQLTDAGNAQYARYSTRSWPITGGRVMSSTEEADIKHSILITGHGDGTVCFWDASAESGLNPIYRLSTADLFETSRLASPTSPSQGTTDAGTSRSALHETMVTDTEDWPPFRKVGSFGDVVDDVRLSIQSLEFNVLTSTLVVAGSAGQVIVFGGSTMLSTPRGDQVALKTITVDIVPVDNQYVWSGCEALVTRSMGVGAVGLLAPLFVVQMNPPTACTALAMHSTWNVFAVGSSYGYYLFDLAAMETVFTQCTLAVVTAGSATGGKIRGGVTRSKSLRTLRESFRRLRIRHVSKSFDIKHEDVSPSAEEGADTKKATTGPAVEGVAEGQKVEDGVKEEGGEKKVEAVVEHEKGTDKDASSVPSPEKAVPQAILSTAETSADKQEAAEVTSAEGAVTPPAAEKVTETKEEGSSPAVVEVVTPVTPPPMYDVVSTIHVIAFIDTFIIHGQPRMPTMWVGDSLGHVSLYQLTVPAGSKRTKFSDTAAASSTVVEEESPAERITCTPAKELRLKHGAPVIGIVVVDRDSRPLSLVSPSSETPPTDATVSSAAGGHRVIICSQQQIKIFVLPSLKPLHKHKFVRGAGAANESDGKVHSVVVSNFMNNKGDMAQTSSAVVCLTNDDVVHVLSIPQLKQVYNSSLGGIDSTQDSSFSSFSLCSVINSCVFSRLNGAAGFFLHSSSEFVRFDLSALPHTSRPNCYLDLKEGMRPNPPPAAEEPKLEETGAEPIVPADLSMNESSVQQSGVPAALDDSTASATLTAGDITADSIHVHVSETSSPSGPLVHTTSIVQQTTSVIKTTSCNIVQQQCTTTNGCDDFTTTSNKQHEQHAIETKTVVLTSTHDDEDLKKPAAGDMGLSEVIETKCITTTCTDLKTMEVFNEESGSKVVDLTTKTSVSVSSEGQ